MAGCKEHFWMYHCQVFGCQRQAANEQIHIKYPVGIDKRAYNERIHNVAEPVQLVTFHYLEIKKKVLHPDNLVHLECLCYMETPIPLCIYVAVWRYRHSYISM